MNSDKTLALDELTVAAVARRLGVAPATLRTWDRRYGLGPTDHPAGSHRRYSQLDLARVTLMRRFILGGMSPARAAQKALEFDGELLDIDTIAPTPEFEANMELVDFLFKTAKAMDTASFAKALSREFDRASVEDVYETVIVPLLQKIGAVWQQSSDGVAVEHLISDLVIRALTEVTITPDAPLNQRPVLLSCVENEPHSIPLYALAAALSQRNIAYISLGAKTPQAALVEVIKKFAPPVIFLWAQQSELGKKNPCIDLPIVRPAAKVIVAGPGWDPEVCGDTTFTSSLSGACAEIASTFTL